MHPEYPVASGPLQMTSEWALSLPEPFNRRIEDASLVLWRPALTFWIAAWNNDHGTSMDDRLAGVLRRASAARSYEQVERSDGVVKLTYELPEEDPERPITAYISISGHVFSEHGHLQISAYFDTPAARSLGYQVIHSVRHVA